MQIYLNDLGGRGGADAGEALQGVRGARGPGVQEAARGMGSDQGPLLLHERSQDDA